MIKRCKRCKSTVGGRSLTLKVHLPIYTIGFSCEMSDYAENMFFLALLVAEYISLAALFTLIVP